MDYALEIKAGTEFISSEGATFTSDKDVNFKIDSEFEPTEISVYQIDTVTNKPEYYLLKKENKSIFRYY